MDAALSEVNSLAEKFLDLKKKIEEIELRELKPLNDELVKTQGKLISLLETNNLKKFASSKGSVTLVVTKRVDMPDGDNKIEFVSFLKEIGEWDTLASIHSAKLNSWLNEKMEENPLFTAPGIGLPKENKYLKRGK